MSDDVLDLLTDAVHYDHFRSPFHGDGAQFACLYAADAPVGIGPLHARAAMATRFITVATAQLWLRHAGAWQAVHRQHLRSHPVFAEESGCWRVGGGEVTVTARTIYADERTAWHEQIIVNTGTSALTIDLALAGQIDRDRSVNEKLEHRLGQRFIQRQHFVDIHAGAVRVGHRGEPQLPCPAVQIDPAAGLDRVERSELPVWAAGAGSSGARTGSLHWVFRSDAVHLAPGQSRRLLLRIVYVPAWHAAPVPAWPQPMQGLPDLENLLAAQATVRRAKLASAAGDSQLARARYALMRCAYQGRDGAYGANRACLCTPGITFFSVTFFWDSLFSAAALSAFDPAHARGAMQVPLLPINGRYEQRNWDWRIRRNENIPQPQAPVASWALAHHLALNDDPAFLAQMYPQLSALHRFWQTQDADGDGLPEWSFTGLNADNGPHYAPYMPYGVHNVFIPPIASVSLASFLHLDALLLAEFATRLEKHEEAQGWRARAAFLAERLDAVCWHEADGCHYDYDHHLGEHNRTRTHLLFWPLWAGVPMAAQRKRRLLDRLLDPGQFNGPIPFPTCAYDDPHYDPEAYWSGRSWPQISYWLIELLVREGHRDEAIAAADRWLAWQSAHTGHREAVTTDPNLSEHCENESFTYRTGRDFDYNWAAAAVALLRERRYDRYVPLGAERSA